MNGWIEPFIRAQYKAIEFVHYISLVGEHSSKQNKHEPVGNARDGLRVEAAVGDLWNSTFEDWRLIETLRRDKWFGWGGLSTKKGLLARL